ncbi:MAG: hydratase [Acidaminococcus sp.]|jgi:aconitate hydratase|nr:hydratase [Acidaminococcus sp.]MCI2117064.1 hydratase [Acidaminococcus sp.]
MIQLFEHGAYLLNGQEIIPEEDVAKAEAKAGRKISKEEAKKGTIAYRILKNHNQNDSMDQLKIKFDALTSHDITYVGIIQTARASGMKKFPLPYVLTCCHNSLCAVGGTINEDDHMFGLTAAKKYGGIFVPPHMAVIHQYMREMYAGCGRMILGSDSHTRYGALGTMAVGEGGGELDKQILGDTWDNPYPGVVAVYLTGKPQPWVGPHDIALAICRAVYKNGYVKNKVMEFVGPGVASMTTDYRNAVDVMTTETTCLSSIWRTDEDTHAFLKEHGREDAYKKLDPEAVAYYDGCVYIDLSTIKPMIAMPFHPSNAYEIDEFKANMMDILRETEKAAAKVSQGRAPYTLLDKVKDGKFQVQQGVIGGCAGGNYVNVVEAANLLRGKTIGAGEFTLNVYPSSMPVYMDLAKKGFLTDLMAAGAVIKTAFCGPCFGAGDTPNHNGFSIRHTTRNFPNREGSKPGKGQMAAVALMDARSIAATAANNGILTSAEEFADVFGNVPAYHFDEKPYESRVYNGFGKAEPDEKLFFGPNIKDWPELPKLGENILLKVCSKIEDPVTTTDELIPSGETSSFRSNPLGLAEFTLSRRDPEYVGRTKAVKEVEIAREKGENLLASNQELADAFKTIHTLPGQEKADLTNTEIGSTIYANKPGDGSAREQAASCQRVIGALANIVRDYATKRYRSNVINWGMLPFHLKDEKIPFEVGDLIYVPAIREALNGDMQAIRAYVIRKNEAVPMELYIKPLNGEEKEIIKAGCLINFNRARR